MFSWAILPLIKAIYVCHNWVKFTHQKMFSLMRSDFLILIFLLNLLLLFLPILSISVLHLISSLQLNHYLFYHSLPIQKICRSLSHHLLPPLQSYLLDPSFFVDLLILILCKHNLNLVMKNLEFILHCFCPIVNHFRGCYWTLIGVLYGWLCNSF